MAAHPTADPTADLAGPLPRISVVLLVDRRGHVLLMERDEHAPRSPEQWGMVGGHVEDDEDHDTAAYRELAEETGVELPAGALTRWLEDTYSYPDGAVYDYVVYAASTNLTDADIMLGEGRQIVFVAPERIPELDLAGSAAHFLPRFLASDLYRDRPDQELE